MQTTRDSLSLAPSVGDGVQLNAKQCQTRERQRRTPNNVARWLLRVESHDPYGFPSDSYVTGDNTFL